jgi:hypothetical protein
MVAIAGLLAAVLVGWAMMSIGARRIDDAERVRVQAQSKLQIAVFFAAQEAIAKLREARLDLHNQNWGSAQMVLSRVEDHITFMEQVAADTRREEVSQIRNEIGELQRAVGEQSRDSMDRLDALEAALDDLAQEQ